MPLAALQHFSDGGGKLLDMVIFPCLLTGLIGGSKQPYADAAGQAKKKQHKDHFHKKESGFGMCGEIFHGKLLLRYGWIRRGNSGMKPEAGNCSFLVGK